MFNLPFRFAYITLCVPFVIVWLILFFIRKDTRKEQLSLSYAGAILGPLSEIIYFRDYWLPASIFPLHIGRFPFMIEDVIFGFAIGGIAAVIYEVVFRERLSKFSVHPKRVIKSFSIVIIFIFTLFFLLALGINSIYASSIAFVVAAIPMIYVRHDLFLNAIGSGLCVMLIMLISYFLLFNVFVANSEELFKQGWLIYGTSLDIRFVRIPLTEMIWGFTWGF